MPPPIEPSLFKAYDVRGIVGRGLDAAAARAIGAALGTEARERAVAEIAVGRDGRLSGPWLRDALVEGLRSTGTQVADVGCVTTPMLYFACHHLGCGSGVAITGSHNPPDYNGMKFVLQGESLHGEGLQSLRRRIEAGRLAVASAPGTLRTVDVAAAYQRRIAGDVVLARPLRVVVDAGNGIAGAYAPALYRALGCEVLELYCEVDGHFPNHHPDPANPENLRELIVRVRESGADLGLAFDGDGDRLGVVTRQGGIIYPDRQLMLFARDVLARQPGAEIVFDVKCSRHLAPWIRRHGGRPTMWRTGHSLIKAKLRDCGAALAGELSGHLFFNDRWYGFDDGLYAGARLLEIASRAADPSALLEALPDAQGTPELHLPLADGDPHRLIERLRAAARFPGAREIIDIDGLRVEYDDGFGLARASNTTPVVVLRFEADSEAALVRIQDQFRAALHGLDPALALPF